MTFKRIKKAVFVAFPHTLPVLMGFGCLGITYGILLNEQGYNALWAFLFSALCLCGSMQFISLTLLTLPFDPISAFLMSLLVNARHIFYGLSMLEKYQMLGKVKIPLIFGMCDETFSILSSIEVPHNIPKQDFYLAVSALNYSYWVIASVVGGLIGSALTFDLSGLDFVLTALIFVLFLEKWREKANRRYAMIGVVITFICLLIFGTTHFLLPAMIILLVILYAMERGNVDA